MNAIRDVDATAGGTLTAVAWRHCAAQSLRKLSALAITAFTLAACGGSDNVSSPAASTPGGSTDPAPAPADPGAGDAAPLAIEWLNISNGGVPIENGVYTSGHYSFSAAPQSVVPGVDPPLEIRGRGNTTWYASDKKPYRLRLETAREMLGMPSNRHWVLLAKKWNAMKSSGDIDGLLDYIDRRSSQIGVGQQLNFQRWDVWNTQLIYLEPLPLPVDYADAVRRLRSWLAARILWPDTEFSQLR